MKTKFTILLLTGFVFFSTAQYKTNLHLKDLDIKTPEVIALKETTVSYFSGFTPETAVNYTFNKDGYITSDRYNSKIVYQNSYTTLTQTSKEDNNQRSYYIIKTPFASYLAATNQITKNENGSLKNAFFKSNDGKNDVSLEFRYEANFAVSKPSVSFMHAQIYTNEGLLLRELNNTLGNYYNAYDSKTNLITVKLFNLSKGTDDSYYLHTYEFDAFGNWIVRYTHQSIPAYGKQLDQITDIEVREITYKNGIKTGYSAINDELKNKGIEKTNRINLTVLEKDAFPVYFDYKEKPSSNTTSTTATNSSNCEGDCENGWGKHTTSQGVYNGFWVNGTKNGFGYYTWSNKDTYYGNWEANYMQGPGVYKYANGDQFMGTFLKNKFHGEAIVSFKSTAEIQYNYYENSTFVKTLDFKNNAVTSGCVNGDCANGFGKYVFNDGGIYLGTFTNYKLKRGTYLFPDGSTYFGDFNTLSQHHGYGFISLKDTGIFYYGQWKNNKYDGRGYALINNKFEIGEFKEGKLIQRLRQ